MAYYNRRKTAQGMLDLSVGKLPTGEVSPGVSFGPGALRAGYSSQDALRQLRTGYYGQRAMQGLNVAVGNAPGSATSLGALSDLRVGAGMGALPGMGGRLGPGGQIVPIERPAQARLGSRSYPMSNAPGYKPPVTPDVSIPRTSNISQRFRRPDSRRSRLPRQPRTI